LRFKSPFPEAPGTFIFFVGFTSYVFIQIMSRQQRLTLTMPTQDKGQLFIRLTTEAKMRQQKIYQALGITADSFGKKKTTVENK
jgi:hypothetical protein